MKKWIAMVLLVVMSVSLLSACNNGNANLPNTEKDMEQSEQIRIVTTIFPTYDWVREIVGENADHVELTMLYSNGADLHSYQSTAEDILNISNCDVFICVGGESDLWVEEVLQQANNPDIKVIKLMDVLGSGVKAEEVVEGMETEHIHEHDEDEEAEEHEYEEEHNHEEDVEYDEHVWLSLKNAILVCDSIAETLVEIDPDNSVVYQTNVEAYKEKLTMLDMEYTKAVEDATQTTILFGDRFPFRYLVDDYGLSYYAAFVGCSAETEASFETVIFLAEKVDELELQCVCIIERSNPKLAQTIIENTQNKNMEILVLNSMQSITSEEVANGATYLSIMENNLDVLKKALR